MKFIDIRSFFRGHQIKLDDSKIPQEEREIFTLLDYNKKHGRPDWIYVDNLQIITDERPCAKCGSCFKQMTPDACLGHIDGVSGACCGHGIDKEKYVNFPDDEGKTINLTGELYDLFMKYKNIEEFKKNYSGNLTENRFLEKLKRLKIGK
jgi:hypothetical protein